ncbi:unnamed protein product [Wuchereria bancrofti]|uniref:Uncharacterized protein n=1 Tax=Wuchereria bancrofti TaxID=6293 RepID=A0A3P7DTE1_WUCBA|nr:unnamed protein product [Wuchereria bancrofti]
MTGKNSSDEYDVCCGALHSYVASDSLTWPVVVPLFVLYISFLSYLSGPVGLYVGHRLLIALYYYRIAVIFLFALAWLVINSNERKTTLDIVLTTLWFLTAFTYFFGWYVHRRTYKFFSTRLALTFDAILRELSF